MLERSKIYDRALLYGDRKLEHNVRESPRQRRSRAVGLLVIWSLFRDRHWDTRMVNRESHAGGFAIG